VIEILLPAVAIKSSSFFILSPASHVSVYPPVKVRLFSQIVCSRVPAPPVLPHSPFPKGSKDPTAPLTRPSFQSQNFALFRTHYFGKAFILDSGLNPLPPSLFSSDIRNLSLKPSRISSDPSERELRFLYCFP